MKDRQSKREKERKREGEMARRVVRVAAALECVRTNYTLDRALQVLLLPLMVVGGEGVRGRGMPEETVCYCYRVGVQIIPTKRSPSPASLSSNICDVSEISSRI